MKFELEDYKRNVPDADLIVDLQRTASLLGKPSVTINEQNEHGCFHATTMSRRFGSWQGALERAGLKVLERMNIPEEELLEHIEELWVSLGRQPHYRDLVLSGKFGGNTYVRRFGSWRKALEAFVVFINAEEGQISKSAEVVLTAPGPRQGSRDVNWRLRFLVMRRDNFKCKACGRTPATDQTITLDVDHIQAWSKGGSTAFENLQTLCTKCNIGKSNLDFLNPSPAEEQNVKL